MWFESGSMWNKGGLEFFPSEQSQRRYLSLPPVGGRRGGVGCVSVVMYAPINFDFL
jgi:hypothetical protein